MVTGRHQRISRAAELDWSFERARTTQTARGGLLRLRPENRWSPAPGSRGDDSSLLATAEQAIGGRQRLAPPLPAGPELEKLAADLTALWLRAGHQQQGPAKRLPCAPDRRTSLLPEARPGRYGSGSGWHPGATDELLASPEPCTPGNAKRSPVPGLEWSASSARHASSRRRDKLKRRILYFFSGLSTGTAAR